MQSSRLGDESDASPTYTEATHTSPSEVVPIVVRRRRAPYAAPHADDEMLGIARLELPGATLIESMIALRKGSVTARALAEGKAAEIGGFAALEGINRQDLISVVDAIVGVVSELARERGLEWLWIFPRAAFMSLLRAEIPGALPPYHFTVSPDIAGWLPGSSQLEAFRSMRLRGFMEIPLIYQITAGMLTDDLETRRACYEQRMQLGSRLGSLLGRAMISVQRTLRQEIELLYPSSTPASTPASTRATSGESASLPSDKDVSFLPSGLSSDVPLAAYLRRVLSEGGVPAQAYKELSYSLLEIQPGQRILDVGCGAGVDLPALAQIAGPTSTVVGLEINSALVGEARQLAAVHADGTTANMLVFHGDAQQMTIPDAEFDRARTDRALQHFPHPKRALAEIWRVLKPGGMLTLVEPDWGAMVVAPGSAAGDGDESVSKALDWCRRHLAHPLIGRNLSGLLSAMRSGSWQSLKVVVAPFTFSDWKAMDAVLLLSQAARALQQERPEHAAEIDGWLQAVSTASADGSFFGYIPMFYAVAVKAADR
ncbi:MAG TPA: methyltransferase domain-containing protein [Ktedonobacterales bacterium]|nr:methyltransferase domain-containing protein [Ktedonobacterales bacterium]